MMCAKSLRQPALDALPFGAGDDARQQIVREDAFGALAASVDGEGDALIQKCQISRLLALPQSVGGKFEQALVKSFVRGARLVNRLKHLIISRIELVVVKEFREGSRRCFGGSMGFHAVFNIREVFTVKSYDICYLREQIFGLHI